MIDQEYELATKARANIHNAKRELKKVDRETNWTGMPQDAFDSIIRWKRKYIGEYIADQETRFSNL